MKLPYGLMYPAEPYAEVVLIRHGEGEHNISNHEYHRGEPQLHDTLLSNVPSHHYRLTKRGRAQATALQDVLKGLGNIDEVFSSDMARALETAYIATDTLDPKLAIKPLTLLQERSWGACEWRKSTEQPVDVLSSERSFFLPQGWRPERGDSSAESLMRVKMLWSELLDPLFTLLNGRGGIHRTGVFTHGELMWWMDYSIRRRSILDVATHAQMREETPHTCEVRIYRFSPSTPRSFMFRKTRHDAPTTFTEWEHVTPKEPSREDLRKYIDNIPHLFGENRF